MVLTLNSLDSPRGTTRIKMRRSIFGTGGALWSRGSTYDAPTGIALELIRRGAAVRAEPAAAPVAKPEPAPNPLEGVNFASDQAAELAMANGLAAPAFEGIKPTSKSGYTKPDVQRILDRNPR